MEPIRILATPESAFNQNRRISDLIRAQVRHFKHLEEKLPATTRAAIPQHTIATEGEAAKYIAAMTGLLRAGGVAAATARPIPITRGKRPAARPGLVTDIAAEISSTAKSTGGATKSTPRGKK